MGWQRGGPKIPGRKPQAMDEFTEMDDPEFLAERRKVRDLIERTPADEQSSELIARYQRLNDEFIRRASAAWAKASQ
jgi:hypothetical protein